MLNFQTDFMLFLKEFFDDFKLGSSALKGGSILSALPTVCLSFRSLALAAPWPTEAGPHFFPLLSVPAVFQDGLREPPPQFLVLVERQGGGAL